MVTEALGHKIGAVAEDVDGMALEVNVVVVLNWEILKCNVVWSNLEEFEYAEKAG